MAAVFMTLRQTRCTSGVLRLSGLDTCPSVQYPAVPVLITVNAHNVYYVKLRACRNALPELFGCPRPHRTCAAASGNDTCCQGCIDRRASAVCGTEAVRPGPTTPTASTDGMRWQWVRGLCKAQTSSCPRPSARLPRPEHLYRWKWPAASGWYNTFLISIRRVRSEMRQSMASPSR